MNLGKLVATMGVDTRGLAVAQTKMSTFGKTASSEFGKARRAVMSLQGALMTLGVGIGLTAVYRFAEDYETALVDMHKVTTQSFEDIEAQINKLPAALGDSTELMRGYYQVISAGVTEPAEALELLTTASKASKVAHIEQGETVKALTKLMAGYAGEIENTEAAADLLLTTERLGQTTFAELVPIIGDIANISRMAGLESEEMAGSLAVLTQTAGSTAEAATQLKALLRSTIKPTEELKAVFKDYSSIQEAMKDLGLVEFFKRVADSTSNAEEAAKMLGGRQESLIAYSALMSNGFEKATSTIEEMRKSSGTLNAKWAEFEESSRGVREELSNLMKNVLIELGNSTLPALKTAMEFVVNNFDSLISAGKALLEVLVGLKIISIINGFWREWKIVGGAAAATTEEMAAAAISLKLALGGIIAAGFLFWIDKMRKKEKELYDQIVTHEKSLLQIESGEKGRGGGARYEAVDMGYDETAWRTVQPPTVVDTTSTVSAVDDITDSIKDITTESAKAQKEVDRLFETFKGSALTAITQAKQASLDFMAGITEAGAVITDTLTDGAVKQFEVLNNVIRDCEDSVKSLGDQAQEALQTKMQEIPETLAGAFSSAIVYGSNLSDALMSLAKDIMYTVVRAWLLKSIFGGLTGGFSLAGTSWGVGVGMSASLPTMASGGIVTQPTMAVLGEGNEPEAVLPLSKLESLLSDSGGGGSSENIEVNVYNQTGERMDAKSESRFDGVRTVVDLWLTGLNNNVSGVQAAIKGVAR